MNSIRNQLKNKWYRIIPGFVFIITASAFALFFDLTRLKIIVGQHREISALLSLAALIGLTFLCIPSAPLSLLVVNLHGPLVAVILVTLGKTISGIIDYFIGGNINQLAEIDELKQKLPFNLQQLPLNSPWLLFFTRLAPNIGPKFAGVASGLAKVPFFSFFWVTILANLTSGIAVVLVSSGLIKLFK